MTDRQTETDKKREYIWIRENQILCVCVWLRLRWIENADEPRRRLLSSSRSSTASKNGILTGIIQIKIPSALGALRPSSLCSISIFQNQAASLTYTALHARTQTHERKPLKRRTQTLHSRTSTHGHPLARVLVRKLMYSDTQIQEYAQSKKPTSKQAHLHIHTNTNKLGRGEYSRIHEYSRISPSNYSCKNSIS